MIATSPSKILDKTTIWRTGRINDQSREICPLSNRMPSVWIEKTRRRKKKRKKEDPERKQRKARAAPAEPPGLGHTSIPSTLTRTQRNAYTLDSQPTASRYTSWDGTSFHQRSRHCPRASSLLISINSAQATQLSAANVISLFRWRDRG